jgi:hypothetical protein
MLVGQTHRDARTAVLSSARSAPTVCEHKHCYVDRLPTNVAAYILNFPMIPSAFHIRMTSCREGSRETMVRAKLNRDATMCRYRPESRRISSYGENFAVSHLMARTSPFISLYISSLRRKLAFLLTSLQADTFVFNLVYQVPLSCPTIKAQCHVRTRKSMIYMTKL